MISMFVRLYRGYGRLLYGLGVLAGLATFGMMALVAANSLMRKLLNRPIDGTVEITETLLTILIFLAVAFTQYRKGHIRVVLLTRKLPAFWRNGLYLVALLLGFGLFAWSAMATWDYAIESFAVREHEWGTIRFPIYPVKFVVFVGVLLLSIQFLLDAWRQALVACGLIPPEEGPEPAETEI